jgi:hypothetical protein
VRGRDEDHRRRFNPLEVAREQAAVQEGVTIDGHESTSIDHAHFWIQVLEFQLVMESEVRHGLGSVVFVHVWPPPGDILRGIILSIV